jgi:hypothetical protein
MFRGERTELAGQVVVQSEYVRGICAWRSVVILNINDISRISVSLSETIRETLQLKVHAGEGWTWWVKVNVGFGGCVIKPYEGVIFRVTLCLR